MALNFNLFYSNNVRKLVQSLLEFKFPANYLITYETFYEFVQPEFNTEQNYWTLFCVSLSTSFRNQFLFSHLYHETGQIKV